MSEMIWIIALCGAGTFVLRWLPLWHARRKRKTDLGPGRLQLWLSGVGPAAISALLVVALWDVFGTEVSNVRNLSTLAALSCVWVVRRLRGGGVAIPTLSGAAMFGLLGYWLV